MRWLNVLEQKFGKWAWPNLLRYMVGGQAVFYLLEQAAKRGPGESIIPWLTLDWNKLMAGQWWRLFTFYLNPPNWSVFFVIFYVFIVFMISDGMERVWGSFRINLFALLGLISHLGIAWIFGAAYPDHLILAFLIAFALHHGDTEILLMFVIPVKWRWIGWFLLFLVAKDILIAPLMLKVSAGTSLIILYWFIAPWVHQQFLQQRSAAESRKERKKFQPPPEALRTRACQQCGKDDEDTLNRLCLCSRCPEEGAFWCEDHLPAHLKK